MFEIAAERRELAMMDLTGPAGHMAFSITSWGHLLRLAMLPGWKPAGALPPQDTKDTWWGRKGSSPPWMIACWRRRSGQAAFPSARAR